MIRDSLPARVAIQLFAILQTSVAPLSFIYYLHYTIYRESLFHLWFPDLFPSSTSTAATNTSVFLHYWLGFELVFYVYFQITRSRLQRITEHSHARTTEAERFEIFQNALATIDDVRTWLVGWFFTNGKTNERPKFEEIRRENVAEWLAWAFWDSTLEVVLENPRHTHDLYEMLATVEKHYGVTFPPGYDEDICCIRLSLDPMNAIHRPFAFYAVIFTGTQLINALLRWCGLERYGSESKGYYWSNTFEMDIKEVWGKAIAQPYEPERIVYWHYKPQQRASTSAPRKRTPVVFIHGMGLGMISYIEWVLRLLSLDREIFLVELPYVSMRLVEDVPTMQETVREIDQMLENHGHKQAVFVGHSLGSAVVSWVLKNTPKKVAAVIMIDPICFLLHYPDVAYNFVYRIPERANEHIISFFASRELYISHYISRHFHWNQAAFFVSSASSTTPPNASTTPSTSTTPSSVYTLPDRTIVFLSEHDNLVNSPRVTTYLRSHGVDARLMPGLDHASFLFSEEWKARILSGIRSYAEDIDAEDHLLKRVASVVAKVGRKATRASGGGRKGKKTVRAGDENKGENGSE
ncbi:Alpha/Beta hydrolase protein [Endogone sp. FLAS-F59071]|nr:Alpha/Beta hydrolase protein [Endogone sp. FLAS-F59071]|eukprot:RUS13533.1 Alpha/Beta hydrolase protein [Endogone sp. FLAS-F59071]